MPSNDPDWNENTRDARVRQLRKELSETREHGCAELQRVSNIEAEINRLEQMPF